MKVNSAAFFDFYHRIFRSIAYYPVLVATGFFLCSLLIIWLEPTPMGRQLGDWLEIFLVTEADTARLILGSLIGGLISLTVFSFSMVMVVLNRAAATLSPRVVPGLVSQPRHQINLGVNIGTIIFCLILTTNIRDSDVENPTPALGVLLAIIFGIVNLGTFVYFIHNISRSIQVDNVLYQIYRSTHRLLKKRLDNEAPYADSGIPDSESWHRVASKHSGYYKSINHHRLLKILSKHDLQLQTEIYRGFLTISGSPLFRLNKEVDDDVLDELRDCFVFYVEEFTDDHHSYGFKQISEIAVKALSPGINDPGTAIKAVDLLSLLFREYVKLPDVEVLRDDTDTPRLYLHEQGLRELLFHTFAPIREYGNQDAVMMINYLSALRNIQAGCQSELQARDVLAFAFYTVSSIDGALNNRQDRNRINDAIGAYNRLLGGKLEPLPMLHSVDAH